MIKPAFQKTRDDYKVYWLPADKFLYDLCQKKLPNHDNKAAINAKLLIVGRSYATQIERKIKSDGSQGNALWKLAGHFLRYKRRIDRLIEEIPMGNQLTKDGLPAVAKAHASLVDILKEITEDQTTRSFCSKYLHFHRPIVPLYDQFTVKALKFLGIKPTKMLDGGEAGYLRHIEKIYALSESLASERPTVKELDYYLGQIAANKP